MDLSVAVELFMCNYMIEDKQALKIHRFSCELVIENVFGLICFT